MRELGRFLAERAGADVEISSIDRIPGGFSYETSVVTARWKETGGDRPERMILRKAPRGGVLEPYDPSREFRVLEALALTEVPAPRPLWLEASGGVLGTPFYLMELVDGEIPLPWDDSIEGDSRRALHEAFTDALAALHNLDWKALGLAFLDPPADTTDPASAELDRCEETLERVALRPYPILHEVVRWLRSRRPKAQRLSLVHDDYRLGNLVWRDGRIAAVLDWERAFLGDPLADVAFTRMEHLAGWCSITGEMAERYAAKTGLSLDEGTIAYYRVLESLKATLVALTGLRAFADGRSSDLRLVEIGRGAHLGLASLAQEIGLLR